MRSHLHADDAARWPARARHADQPPSGPAAVRVRPPWLVFLAKHLAPRNHARYLLQGVELSEDELAAIRAMPRRRPAWLTFVRRQLRRVFPEAEA